MALAKKQEREDWIYKMVGRVPQELWDCNRHVVRAWFKGGGLFVEIQHARYKNEPRIGLWLCEYYFPRNDGPELVESFQQAVPALLHDEDYMRKAVSLNPNNYVAPSWCDDGQPRCN
jgi:hypothetical protein